MRTRSSWRRTATLLVTGAMVLAACGGGDEPADDGAAEEPADDGGDEGDDTEEPADDGGEDAGGEVTFAEGVTEEPCPEAVNPDNGCIYIGLISDLTQGPFAPLGGPITDAQVAFWNRVNEQGGIGGAFDVDAESYIRDNLYNPETHNQVYQEIKPDILALGQTLGSPTTQAIIGDLEENDIVAAPASWTSTNEFDDVILESGNNYCVEASNGLDYFAQENGMPESIVAVGYPGDYGEDGAAGAKLWADANGVDYTFVEQVPVGLGGTVDGAVSQIVSTSPAVVTLTVAPTETAQIVGGAAAQGYTGRFIGNSPSWNPALLASPAADALTAFYWQAGPWGPWDTDSAGHNAMREAVMATGVDTGNDGYTSGWAWSYPLLAALEAAHESGDLTRAGVRAAVESLTDVDYEGMLPAEAGNFTGTAKEQSFNQTVISQVNAEADSGVSLLQDFFEGPTASGFAFDEPCYIAVDVRS